MTAEIKITACARHVRVSTCAATERPNGTSLVTHDQALIAPGQTHTFYPYTAPDSSFHLCGIEELSAEEEAKLRPVDEAEGFIPSPGAARDQYSKAGMTAIPPEPVVRPATDEERAAYIASIPSD